MKTKMMKTKMIKTKIKVTYELIDDTCNLSRAKPNYNCPVCGTANFIGLDGVSNSKYCALRFNTCQACHSYYQPSKRHLLKIINKETTIEVEVKHPVVNKENASKITDVFQKQIKARKVYDELMDQKKKLIEEKLEHNSYVSHKLLSQCPIAKMMVQNGMCNRGGFFDYFLDFGAYNSEPTTKKGKAIQKKLEELQLKIDASEEKLNKISVLLHDLRKSIQT